MLERRQFLALTAAGLASPLVPNPLLSGWGSRTSELLAALQDPSLERRKAYWAQMQRLVLPTRASSNDRVNAHGDKSFEQWQARTGELPPDFQLLPSVSDLPDPLLMLDERVPQRITTAAQWRVQRTRMQSRLTHWMLGKMPPAPGNTRGIITDTKTEGDCTVHEVRLEFGPEHRGTLRVQLFVPPGPGPFPVFLTNHQRLRAWVNAAVRRGYIGCIYQAIDDRYNLEDFSEKWLDLYPEYDFSTLTRHAWGAMRAVDYLHTLPNVDKQRIALGGHSRNSKQALIAAAYDERIGAVVPSRGNSGDNIPWRYTDEMYIGEPMEEITRLFPNWYHPRLRFFVGREHKLPIDQNYLASLVAPRGLLFSDAYMEHQANFLGVEQNYRSVKTVYRMLGHEENVGLMQEPGEHPSSAEDVMKYFDFFDRVFARRKFPHPQVWVHGYTYAGWLQSSGERIAPQRFPVRRAGDFLNSVAITQENWPERRKALRKSIGWVLGDEPPHIGYPLTTAKGISQTSEGWQGDLFSRPGPGGRMIPYGDDLQAYMYSPAPGPGQASLSDPTRFSSTALRTAKLPVVIWLHPYSYATGFSRDRYWEPLRQSGFAVVAFDQLGFGARSGHALRFYDRHPHWSLLGKMVADTRAVVDGILEAGLFFDPSRIYLHGSSLGAKVALFAAAMDDRIAGISTSCGFQPFRAARGGENEGLHHYSHIHGLLPRLGSFVGHESRVPVDYDEVLAAIAPRPVQVIAPTLDRHANVDDVREVVTAAQRVYSAVGGENKLNLETPEDFNRYLSLQMQQVEWLTKTAGLKMPAPPPDK